MDYKNLLTRLSLGIILLTIYIILIYLDKNYIIPFGTLLYLIIIYEILRFFKNNLYYLTYIYIIFSFVFFLSYTFFYFDYLEFNFFIFIIIIFDVSSYLFGKKYGKKKLIINLSPNKTIEGLIGGVITTNLLSVIFILYFYKILFLEKILFINLIILTALCGDLLQSYFKRKNNLKDSSNYLPGHGGYFDRFDSFIFSIIFLFFYTLFTK